MMVMIGCNNRLTSREEFLSSIANLGKGFLEIFVAFGNMITRILGIKAKTKKSEIGQYLSKIAIL